MTRFSFALALAGSIAAFVATGCLSSSPTDGDGGGDGDGEPLARDTYFTGYPAGYSSPAECLARSTHPHQWDCAFELALCANGDVSLRYGDIATDGTYVMDAGIARGTIETKVLALDIATAAEPEGRLLDHIRWTPDTEGRWGREPFATNGCH